MYGALLYLPIPQGISRDESDVEINVIINCNCKFVTELEKSDIIVQTNIFNDRIVTVHFRILKYRYISCSFIFSNLDYFFLRKDRCKQPVHCGPLQLRWSTY